MTTRVVHCKIEPDHLYIGRGSKYGNRWSHKDGTTADFKVSTREEAIALHKEWLLAQPDLLLEVRAMKGKTLGCWCKHNKNPLACHGDTFAWIADMPEAEFAQILSTARKIRSEQDRDYDEGHLPKGRIPFADLDG